MFATRSPFRPNHLGLSVVKLEGIDADHPQGPALAVSGLDLVNGTPVFDIKPYLPYADSLPEARGGFAPEAPKPPLKILVDEAAAAAWNSLSERKREFISETLGLDPRPAFRQEPREYGLTLAGVEACLP